jgi:Outer membrane protein beta-barrel domain
MRHPILAAALLVALVPAGARAQRDLYRFELTPTVSYRFGGTLSGSDSPLFNTDLKVDDSAAYGVTFDIPLSSRIQLELLANRQSSQLRFDNGLFGGSSGVADIDVTYYHVGMLWQWGNDRITPFFTASLGVGNIDPKVPGASAENRFSGSLGGGVKVLFSDSVGLRFEGRGFFSDLGSNNSHHDHGCDYYSDSCYGNDFSQGQASIGLILAW